MVLEIPGHIAADNNGHFIFDRSDQFDHRGMILRNVCQLEYDFKLFLIEAFRKINPSLRDEIADELQSMFGPDRPFGSLSKCLKVATLLKLIEENEAQDLKAMVNLRNMYAHGRNRQQLYEDSASMAFIREMHIVRNSATVLGTRDEQDTFLCAVKSLNEIVLKKTTDLKKSRQHSEA